QAAGLAKLAEILRFELPLLTDVCVRFWEDAQVRLVLLLYQVEGDGSDRMILDEASIRSISALDDAQYVTDRGGREQQRALIAQAAKAANVVDDEQVRSELDELARAYEGARATMQSGL